MRSLSALALSAALLVLAAPSLAQNGHGRGHGPERGQQRGGGQHEGAYGGLHGAYSEQRGGYSEPHGGYGYQGPPPVYGGAPVSQGSDWSRQQDEARAGVRQGRYVGLARVIGAIRRRSPGRQLDAGLEDWGGRTVYRVRWAMPGGRRIDYIVDAQSGAILHVDGR